MTNLSEPTTPPACWDCKHCIPRRTFWPLVIPVVGWAFFALSWFAGDFEEFAHCAKSPRGAIWRKKSYRSRESYNYCSTERGAWFDCGPMGKNFERK